MPRIILLGPPGSGKGTKGSLLAQQFSIPIISSGDALRSNLDAGTDLGFKAKSYMEAGELVPDDLIIALAWDLIDKANTDNGFLLDGFPRTLAQAESFDQLLEEKDIRLDKVFYLNVQKEVLIERLANRRVCGECGEIFHLKDKPPKKDNFCDVCNSGLSIRKDDDPATVENRIVVYEELTKPLVDYYKEQGLLMEIDAGIEIDAQVSQMAGALENA